MNRSTGEAIRRLKKGTEQKKTRAVVIFALPGKINQFGVHLENRIRVVFRKAVV